MGAQGPQVVVIRFLVDLLWQRELQVEDVACTWPPEPSTSDRARRDLDDGPEGSGTVDEPGQAAGSSVL